MKFNWGGLFRVAAPRLLGLVASSAAGWVFVHSHGAVTLDPTQMVELGTTMLGVYAAAHTGTAAAVNPTAAASPIVAQEGVTIKKELTADNKIAEVK